jgi:hypothetical protein
LGASWRKENNVSNLLTTSKSFLEWAQSLPGVVIPAGLESDMKEAIAEDYSERNLNIIAETMQELNVSDCEEIPAAIRLLKQ